MTCIIFLRTKDGFVLGADRNMIVADECVISAQPKIIKKHESCYLTAAGSIAISNILTVFNPPERRDGQDPYCYMVERFVPAFRSLLSDNMLIGIRDDFSEFDGTLAVLIDGRMFRITCRFSVMEPSADWLVIGSGAPYALGSLHTTDGFEETFGITARSRVMLALESAASIDCGVRRPFDIIEVS